MYPHERSLVKQLADKPFALIGINSDRDIETARKAVTKKNLTGAVFGMAKAGPVAPSLYAGTSVPGRRFL